VNNAGLERMTPLDDATDQAEAVFRRVLEINVVGTYLATRAAVRAMPDGGAIVNTASVWSRSSEAGFAAYVASKHATIGLTKTWAKELGPRGIRVNAVAPGVTVTEMTTDLVGSEEGLRRLRDMPLGRYGRADEVADSVIFLLSDAASLYLGQTLNPNAGGYMP
jgi:NAD(P)-dependent dehydrogenase (short-subunit alcohol dehydrogenase family)